MADKTRNRLRARAARMPGVRFVRRPADDTSPAFDLGYVRTGPASRAPALIVPGGPGLASVLPYHGLRRRAAAQGLDVIMAEHRGVGLSRTGTTGEDLPRTAMTLRAAADDLAAVLDAEQVPQAVVYGSSYGSYLAQAFAAWHPDRVAAMVLDSAMSGPDDHRHVRVYARRLLWDGDDPRTVIAAKLLRGLVHSGTATLQEACEVARIVYEFAGLDTLERLLRERTAGRVHRTWRWLASLGSRETEEGSPFVMEFDLVGRIAHRELNYAPEPDGGPFDPAASLGRAARAFGPFEGAPLDLAAHWPRSEWPVIVLSGERDLRTPRPVAERIAAAVPDGVLVPVPATGHSALDTHGLAALAAVSAAGEGRHRAFAADPRALAALPRIGASRHIASIVRAGIAAETLLPRRVFCGGRGAL